MSILSEIWLGGDEAAEVASEANGRTISKAYIQHLGRRNRIRMIKVNQKAALYHREDCAAIVIKPYVGKPNGRPRKQLPLQG